MFTQKTRVKPLQIVTLTEAKAHLNVTHDDDDNLIRMYIESVSETIEGMTNRLLSECTVNAELTLRYFDEEILIPFGGVQAMTSVQVDGEDINYTFSAISQRLVIPAQAITLPAKVTVQYTAGNVVVPPSLEHATLIWISDAYEYRENKIEGQFTSAPLPAATLINRYRVPASIDHG